MDSTWSSRDPVSTTPTLPDSALKSIKGLKFVFWGLLIVFADFTIKRDNGIPFDFVNDAIGAFVLAIGLFKLRRASDELYYRVVIGVVWLAALILLALKVVEHFSRIEVNGIAGLAVSAAQVLLNVGFATAMIRMSRTRQLPRAEKAWRRSRIFFFAIYGSFLLAALWFFARAEGLTFFTRQAHYRLPDWTVVPGVVLLTIPLLAAFVAMRITWREAERAPAAGSRGPVSE